MRFRVEQVCLALVALSSVRGSAQLPKCPNSGRVVAQPCELDQWPLADRQRLNPIYPEILRQAGVSGEVLVRYVSDTAGIARVSSVEVLRSSHILFTTAVRNAMPRQRLEPARRAGLLTNVTVEETVTFVHPAPGWTLPRQEHVIRHSVDSTGRLLTTVYAFTPRDSASAPVLTGQDSIEISGIVVEELMRTEFANEPPVAWCVEVGRRAPSAEMFARWRSGGRRVVTIADCPKTYASMVYTPGDPKRPRGWVDPVQISVDSIVSWAADRVIVATRTGKGMASTVNQCEVIRVTAKWTKASCVTTQYRVS